MTIRTSEVIFREDLYPRIEPNARLIQQYAENIDNLPPIEINQHNILIDGYHRWTAHKKAERETIEVNVIQTASDNDLLAMSIEKNAKHGMQLSSEDKKKMAVRLYNAGTGKDKAEICKILSISNSTVTSYLTDIDKQLKEERKAKIFSMYLAGYTMQEIAEAVGIDKANISREIENLLQISSLAKSQQLHASFQDSEFETPIYNVKTKNIKPAFSSLGCRWLLLGAGWFPVPEGLYDINLLRAYIGIKSIIGRNNFATTHKSVILSRMLGCKSNEALTAFLSENDDAKETYDKYSGRKRMDKLLFQLMERKLVTVLSRRHENRIYVSTKLRTPVELATAISQKREEKNLLQQIEEARRML